MMTRPYAALKLLEHGALTASQFKQITGWPVEDCRITLDELEQSGQVKKLDCRLYAHAEHIYAVGNATIVLPSGYAGGEVERSHNVTRHRVTA